VLVRRIIQKGSDFFARQEPAFRINLFKVSVQNFFVYLTQQYQSIFVTGLGATPLQLGIMNSVGGLATAATAAPTGWLADRRGIRAAMLLGMFPMIFGALIFAIAQDWIAVIPALIISTFALQMETTACPMVCGNCLKSEERATGMQLCDTLSAIPRIVSPIVAAVIVTAFGGIGVNGIRPLYYVQLAGFILVLLIIMRMFVNPGRKSDTFDSGGMREVFQRGSGVKKWIVYTCLSTFPMFVNPLYIPLYAAEVKGADQFILGSMAAASMIIPLILSIPVGHWADRVGRKKIMYVTTMFHCSSLVLLILSPNSTTLISSSILQGFFTLAQVTQAAMSAELMPTHLLGRWYGLLGFFRGLVSVAAPVVAGLIWDSVGSAYVFVFLIVTELGKMIVLTKIPETLKAGQG
jgi:MFS family permease